MSLDEHREQGVFHLSIDGEEYRVPQYCPHRAGRLDHGEINRQRRTIACPLHHSVFSLDTGEQLSGPPCGRLAVAKCAAIG
jgi:nitrite reductase/ring-hydroxylating ferredoxin subunit